MTIHAVDKNMSVANTIIEYRDRPEESESKLNTYGDGIKVIFTIMKLFRVYRPFAFFGLVALILSLISTGFVIPVLIDYAKTGLVERFPTLIVCGIVYLAALLSLFSGLILGNIKQKHRQDFETSLINTESQYKIMKQLDRRN